MYSPDRTTWFVVADGAHLRLFESGPEARPWRLVHEDSDDEARKRGRELARGAAPRGRGGSGARFSIEFDDLHAREEARFVETIAASLNEASLRGEFDQLVLALPPKALGELRKKLSPDITSKVTAALDKDLIKLSEHELLEYFKTNLDRW